MTIDYAPISIDLTCFVQCCATRYDCVDGVCTASPTGAYGDAATCAFFCGMGPIGEGGGGCCTTDSLGEDPAVTFTPVGGADACLAVAVTTHWIPDLAAWVQTFDACGSHWAVAVACRTVDGIQAMRLQLWRDGALVDDEMLANAVGQPPCTHLTGSVVLAGLGSYGIAVDAPGGGS